MLETPERLNQEDPLEGDLGLFLAQLRMQDTILILAPGPAEQPSPPDGHGKL
jgi:hypothetical protein